MKPYNDYNEINRKAPPVPLDYVVETVLDDNGESIDVSPTVFQDNLEEQQRCM